MIWIPNQAFMYQVVMCEATSVAFRFIYLHYVYSSIHQSHGQQQSNMKSVPA